jgi:hypothetical protein
VKAAEDVVIMDEYRAWMEVFWAKRLRLAIMRRAAERANN